MSSRVSEWTTNVKFLALEDGDLIEISRGHYSHWTVYIGKGEVAHFNPLRPNEKVDASEVLALIPGNVTKTLLITVAGNSYMRVNNKPELEREPRSFKGMKKVLDDYLAKQGLQYNLITFNCEHFVTMLKFKVVESLQIRKIEAFLARQYPALIASSLGYDNLFRKLQDLQSSVVTSKLGNVVRIINI